MFNANVKRIDDRQVRTKITVYVDTLYEAEIYLTRLLSNLYSSTKIILVYEYDMLYSIYDGEQKIGSIVLQIGD